MPIKKSSFPRQVNEVPVQVLGNTKAFDLTQPALGVTM